MIQSFFSFQFSFDNFTIFSQIYCLLLQSYQKMNVLLFSKRVYYPLRFLSRNFHNTSFSIFVAKIHNNFFVLHISLYFFHFCFYVFVTKSRSSHNFFCKKWHLISSSIFFLVRCMLVKNINTSSLNLFSPSSFMTNFSSDNLVHRILFSIKAHVLTFRFYLLNIFFNVNFFQLFNKDIPEIPE